MSDAISRGGVDTRKSCRGRIRGHILGQNQGDARSITNVSHAESIPVVPISRQGAAQWIGDCFLLVSVEQQEEIVLIARAQLYNSLRGHLMVASPSRPGSFHGHL